MAPDTAPISFYSGTSGLVLPITKRLFPPGFQDKSRLTYYASLVNSIEINSSFYKVPMASTVQKWAAEVPVSFQFTFKLWREITHTKQLAFNQQDVERFMQVIANAGPKKGCLLVQFPPSVKIDKVQQVQSLLQCITQIDEQHEWKIAVEFRDAAWYQESVYEMLQQYGASMVLHDKRSVATPMVEGEASFVYLRFHGPGGDYRGTYEDDFLYEYAQYIKAWQEDGKTVFVYFNNTMGNAIQNLRTLNKYVAGE